MLREEEERQERRALGLRLVVPFLLILVCLFALSVASMQILSAVRGYVGGESMWSKGQKEAVHHLRRYAAHGDPADFRRYEAAIAVPLGDRLARLELEKPNPDRRVAREGFRQGRNDPADIEDMIRLFLWLRHVDAIDRAISIWADADAHIENLAGLAVGLRTAVEKSPRDPGAIEEIMAWIDREAETLTSRADSFTYTLGQGSRDVERFLVWLLAIATATLATLVALSGRAALREREAHQQELRESEDRYRAFFESSIDPVLIGHADGRLEARNAAAHFVLGPSDPVRKGNWDDELQIETRDSLRFAMSEGARTGHFRGSLPFRRRDGRSYVGDVSAARYTNRAGEERVSVVVRDISERIRAEEEVRRLNASLEERVAARTAELEAANRDLSVFNRELESFCYSVSHDLRLPLRSMNGFSRMLAADYADSLDDQAMDYLRRIQEACQRMGKLIDDLLDLTRHTRQKMIPSIVNLTAMAQDLAGELRAGQPGRHVEFVAPAREVRVLADRTLIRLLLRNLLANAWKFSQGVEAPRVEFGVAERDGETVYFVRDNGCGFDMVFADKLFGIFSRLHAAGEFEGTGIGLATVQRIVMRHGGRVWAESAKGEGATFFFTLAPQPSGGDGAAQPTPREA